MLSDFIHSSGSQITKRVNQPKDKNAPSTPKSDKKSLDVDKENKDDLNDSPTYIRQAKELKDQIKEKLQEFIGLYENAPKFLRDNEYIRSGYRINFSTPKMILKSLFMAHNESVNIWSHLGGAILLIMMCVALCFSVSSLDTQTIQNFVQTEVKELFEPIYDKLSDFSRSEFDLSKTFTETKNEIVELGGDAIHSLEQRLKTLSTEIEHAKENLTPEAVGRLLTNLKNQLDSVSSSINSMASSVTRGFDIKKLEEMSSDLKKNLTELQEEFIRSIDSSKFDWIDIYKYLNPDTPSILRKKGVQLVPLSRWPILVFLLSAVFCLMCSAIFHAFYCLNQRAFDIFRRLDYAGISILITGSCFPAFVYGFYCEPFFSNLYLTLVGTASIIVFFVSLGEMIHKEENIHLKAMMYGGLGTFAGLPILHLAYLTMTMSENNGNLNFMSSLIYYLPMGLSYLGGLAIYSTKFPERFKPGGFDIWGHSHQIWHICVLLAIILTYFGAFDNYYARMAIPCVGCEL